MSLNVGASRTGQRVAQASLRVRLAEALAGDEPASTERVLGRGFWSGPARGTDTARVTELPVSPNR